MKHIYEPLRNGWRIKEEEGNVKEQIQNRVDIEDVYTWAKGFPLIKEVSGNVGQPIKAKVEYLFNY